MTDYHNSKFKHLLEPGYIGKVKIRNRILKSGARMSHARDGYVTDAYKAFYAALARGGVGMIILENLIPDFPLGAPFVDGKTLRIDDDRFIPGLTELTRVIHGYGCPTFAQFRHEGPRHPKSWSGLQPVSSSTLPDDEIVQLLMIRDNPLNSDRFLVNAPFHELTIAEIEEIVHKFAIAGARAQKAGFDGVEINAAGGHLLNTFLSRAWNKRQDKYGCQSLENRTRIIVEMIQSTKKLAGKDFPVIVLFNGYEVGYSLGTGLTIAEAQGIAKLLQDGGADAIDVRGMGYGDYSEILWPECIYFPEPPKNLPKELDWSHHGRGAFAPLGAAIKKVVTIPVITVGRFDHVLGEKAIREGKADFIAMTRRLIADPEFPNKVAAGRLEDIAPCTACTTCMNPVPPHRCRINAAMGEEEYIIKPAEKKKKVLVIGGGPSGMEAARVAATRGHQVTLYEKEPVLGGLVPIATLVQGVEVEDKPALLRYLKTQITKLGVDIRMGKEFKPSMLSEIKPDVVILAGGGVIVPLDIPGANRRNVIILSHLDKTLRPLLRLFGPRLVRWATKFYLPGGKRVVIIGGTYYGCEIAELMVKRGRKVTIVHTDEETLGDEMPLFRRDALLNWLRKKGTSIMTGVKVEEITDKGLVVTTREGKRQTIEADTIMPSTVLRPNTELLKALEGKAPEVYAIGDSREPHVIKDAIADGYHIASAI